MVRDGDGGLGAVRGIFPRRPARMFHEGNGFCGEQSLSKAGCEAERHSHGYGLRFRAPIWANRAGAKRFSGTGEEKLVEVCGFEPPAPALVSKDSEVAICLKHVEIHYSKFSNTHHRVEKSVHFQSKEQLLDQ